MKLTARSIDSLVPGKRDKVIWDDELSGFGLRCNPGGKWTFVVQYRNVQGRSRRLSIGKYGTLTPAEARKEAKRLLRDADLGDDPAEKRRQEKCAITVAQLCNEYLEKADSSLILKRNGRPKRASTLSVDKGRIERHIKPLLGKKLVKDLTSKDIRIFQESVVRGKTATNVKTGPRGLARVRGGPIAAKRAVGLLGGMLSYAVELEYRIGNPTHGVRKPADRKRKFRLDADGWHCFDRNLRRAESEGTHWKFVTAARLLALTGCRKSEILKLKWSDVDLEARCLYLSHTKTTDDAQERSIRPIGRETVRILADLQSRDQSLFVLTSVRSLDKSLTISSKQWARLTSDFTPQCLRHAFASTAHDLGMSELTIAGVVGHAKGSVTARYVHSADPFLLSAADQIASHIWIMMKGESSNCNGNLNSMEESSYAD